MSDGQQPWRAPDPDLVRRALSRLGDLQHRRVFYEKLDNPLWVDALAREGVFGSPPEVVVREDGTSHSQPWPEGNYLIRMAPLAPESVSRVMQRVSTSSNPYVHELLFRAALALPPDYAATFAKPLARFLEVGSLSHAREVVSLAERLAEAEKPTAALRILQAAFRPRPSGEEATGLGGRRDVRTGLERYWFEDGLPEASRVLVAIQGEKALTTLVSWLQAFMTASGEYVPGRPYDLSHIWRPSIGPHEQNQSFEELGDALIDAVRDLAVADVRGGRDVTDVVAVLERSGQPLSQRIALHVLAVTSPENAEARDLAFERLQRPALMDSDFRHEYAILSRSVLPTASNEQMKTWAKAVKGGPHIDDEKLAKAAEHWRLEDEALDASKVRFREVWRLKLLSAVGRDSLPLEDAEELTSLEERYGVIDHPEFSSYSTSWVGPTSPVTEEGLMAYGVPGLLEYLRTWSPAKPEPWDDPSKEGLARALQTAVSKRSEELSAASVDFGDLDPTYVRAFFSGLTEAVKSGEPVAWGEVLALATAIARKEDDGAEVTGSRDEDTVWRFAQRAMAGLIEQGTRESENGIPGPQLAAAVDALEPLISHADPTAEHEERYGGSNMDPLTLSLNTTRPAVMRALIRVASRAKEDAEEAVSGVSEAVVPRVLTLVDSRLFPERDPSLAEAAALGERFGRLIWIDREWSDQRLSALLSSDAFGDVVGSTALATYQPSRVLTEALSGWARNLLDRVARGDEIVSGWRRDRGPVEVLGDHLMMLRLWDAIPQDDELLTHYFQKAPAEARSKVLGQLGWLLGRTEDVPDGPLQRAIDFFNLRAESVRNGDADPKELGEFYWWARSGKFPPAWWIPLLEQAVAAPGFSARGMLGDVLEENASRGPTSVVTILEALLIRGREEPFGTYDLIEHAPGILVSA